MPAAEDTVMMGSSGYRNLHREILFLIEGHATNCRSELGRGSDCTESGCTEEVVPAAEGTVTKGSSGYRNLHRDFFLKFGIQKETSTQMYTPF